MSEEHWSSPNGCHPDCPACAQERADHPKECTRLANFGAVVLEILETDEWSGDVLERIANEAHARGLAESDQDGYFRRLIPLRENS